ncbi:MAG TPA: hypothetical protein VLX31_14510 [Streptosporangiaceae bacterium]|nr:hypothetical protein [Streptosporangiaceae bacterium]
MTVPSRTADVVSAELDRLAASYPAFRFRTQASRDRRRMLWVAERINGLTPGLHTAITSDLAELQTALDAITHHRQGQS